LYRDPLLGVFLSLFPLWGSYAILVFKIKNPGSYPCLAPGLFGGVTIPGGVQKTRRGSILGRGLAGVVVVG